MTKGKRTAIKILVLFTGLVTMAITVYLFHEYRDKYTVLVEILGGKPPPSVRIQRVYRSGWLFDFFYVYELSHDRDGYSEILKRGFTQGGEPGVEIVIKWIEEEIPDTLDRTKGWTLFRNRVQGKDVYYIVSNDQRYSYLCVTIY